MTKDFILSSQTTVIVWPTHSRQGDKRLHFHLLGSYYSVDNLRITVDLQVVQVSAPFDGTAGGPIRVER